MGDPSDIGALTLAVGEMRGQLRELIHANGNMAQKVDVLAEKAWQAPTSAQYDALARRIESLEVERNRNDGAKGVFAAILQSRFAAWIAATIGAAYIAIDKGLFK